MADFTYEIKDEIKVLSTKDNGWTKELNYISWNGRESKYDLREWAPDREKMAKGITLSREEAEELRDALNEIL